MPPAVTRYLLGAQFYVRLCKGYSPSSSPGAFLPNRSVFVGGFAVSAVLCMHDVVIFNSHLPSPLPSDHQALLSVYLSFIASLPPIAAASALGQPSPTLPVLPDSRLPHPGHPPHGHHGDLQKCSLHLCSNTSDDPLHPTHTHLTFAGFSCSHSCSAQPFRSSQATLTACTQPGVLALVSAQSLPLISPALLVLSASPQLL